LDAKFRGTTATQYYVDVRNGIREIEYVHPDMEPILKETNGIFVFQEDVFKFLVNIADYSWEESDTVRSAIAKKKREVILKTFDRIREATAKRGWTSEQSEEICNQVEAFSRYSFNKSHSKCYGDLGYITVYLKHYYPLEWWTAVLNNIDDEDRIRKYVSVLGGMIKPPSLKKPAKTFTIQDECIRAPLSVLRGIGPATVDELVTKGPFANFDEFLAKINHSRLNVGHFTSLIKSRSADCFMDKTLDYMDARKNLMLDYMTKRKSKPIDPAIIDASYFDIYLMEKEANFCFNKSLLDDDTIMHQLIEKWPALQRTGKKGIPLMMGDTPILNSCRVAEGLVNKEYKDEVGLILLFESSSYAGGISKKSGKPWHKVSVMLSDGYNTIECLLWDQKKAFGWDKNTVVYVKGKLQRGWKDSIQLTVSEMEKIHD
jgi:DNA polymerase III alpha subunit